jgi:hypothetical protein
MYDTVELNRVRNYNRQLPAIEESVIIGQVDETVVEG